MSTAQMSTLRLALTFVFSVVMLHVLFDFLGLPYYQTATSPTPPIRAVVAHQVVTDLIVCTSPPTTSSAICASDTRTWHRINKELHLHKAQQKAWLYLALEDEEGLAADDEVVLDIRVGGQPLDPSPNYLWERRHGGIWILKSKFFGKIDQAITEVDVLFGTDAVDPRPQWTLMQSPLQLGAHSSVPVARLSVLHGRSRPPLDARKTLRVGEDGRFKIVQISDTHMVTGVGICKDAIDADGNKLPKSEADPLTVDLIGKVLDIEKPDLVVYTGDQLHHDILDSQTPIFKVTAPSITRSIPFAAVFGNHDSEGIYALSREAQMSILQKLPLSLCEPGPEQVDGTGNFYLQVLAPEPSQDPLSTLYFFDSHGQKPGSIFYPDYYPISQSQIDWFTNTSQAIRRKLRNDSDDNRPHLSLVFQHIPLPEFGDSHLRIYSGNRREPTEGPSVNSHLYDALVKERVSVVGCGHDHVNDFCALLPGRTQQDSDYPPEHGPFLCHGGAAGFGGYGAYYGKHFHRRMRVFELDRDGNLKTWERVEYDQGRVDEQMLAEGGAVLDPSRK